MAKSAEEIQKDWWERWWQADWSWEGLASKPVGENLGVIHGGACGERNLQEYWRRDPQTGAMRDDAAMQIVGELLRGPDGRFWHAAHLPLHWRDGSPAKAAWHQGLREMLADLIGRRVAAAQATRTTPWCSAEGPDLRAQFSGAVLLSPPHHPSGAAGVLHLVCEGVAMPAWDASGHVFGEGLVCHAINCWEGAVFDGTTFSGNASFAGAIFGGHALFDRASFVTEVSFERASFTGYASFDYALFRLDGGFNHVTFSGDTSFISAIFSRYALFERAWFSDYAAFDRTAFLGDAVFDGACFGGLVSFRGGEFSARADFIGTRFALAPGPGIGRPACSFAERRFKDVANFSSGEFQCEMEFQAAIFERLARFDGLSFPATPALWQGMFNQAQFKDVVSLSGAGCRSFAAFDGAAFGAALQLDNIGEAATQRIFAAELTEARRLDGQAERMSFWPSARIAAWFNRVQREEAKPDKALQHLERGCRVLKQAMEKASDKAREQMFYAFELTARRHQRDTSRAERLFSQAYAITADYGRSIARPVWLFAATIPLFALFYGLIFWTQGAAAETTLIYRSLSLSLGRVFPFGLWQVTTHTYQTDVLGLGETLWSFGLRSLATLQSLLGLTLAFLAGLALRRRFHIN